MCWCVAVSLRMHVSPSPAAMLQRSLLPQALPLKSLVRIRKAEEMRTEHQRVKDREQIFQ